MKEKLTYLISIQQLVLSILFARVLRQMWSGDLLLQKLAVIDLRFFRQGYIAIKYHAYFVLLLSL